MMLKMFDGVSSVALCACVYEFYAVLNLSRCVMLLMILHMYWMFRMCCKVWHGFQRGSRCSVLFMFVMAVMMCHHVFVNSTSCHALS